MMIKVMVADDQALIRELENYFVGPPRYRSGGHSGRWESCLV